MLEPLVESHYTTSGSVETMIRQLHNLAFIFLYATADVVRYSACGQSPAYGQTLGSMLRGLGRRIQRNQIDCIFWDEEFWNLSQSGMEGFFQQPVQPHHLPARPEYWYFQKDVEPHVESMPGIPWWTPAWALNSLFFLPEEPDRPGEPLTKAIDLLVFMRKTSGIGPADEHIPRVAVSYAWTVGDLAAGSQVCMMAAKEFMRHPYVHQEEDKSPGNHAFRKELKRNNLPIPPVRRIMLRRPENRGGPAPRTGTVEWKHRWWVGGHHRHFDRELQSGPYKGSRSTYIFPYPKNIEREDLPMLPPRGNIYEVRR
jgi:hypothetical protein